MALLLRTLWAIQQEGPCSPSTCPKETGSFPEAIASQPSCLPLSLNCCPRAAREAGVGLGAAVPRKDLQVR